MSWMICSGGSWRGLSLVKMTRSDFACTTSEMYGRGALLSWPRQPITVRMFLALPASADSMASTASGVSAASTITLKPWPSSISSERPGTTSTASMPATMLFKGIFKQMPVATAARMLYTLCLPSKGVMICSLPKGVRTMTSLSQMSIFAVSAYTSASGLSMPYVTTGTADAEALTRSAAGSSRLITAACVVGSYSFSKSASSARSCCCILGLLSADRLSRVCTTTPTSSQSSSRFAMA
mmetsp:Transcript_19039/g.53296  ORF Transcript_19039/g.53296 Transcript_19039/m.53296 type:complete len:239 (-) Transcript_19039:1190-1906(-)